MGARPSVVVFDYGFGNVHSAVKALERAGADVELTADRDRAVAADGLLVPGVGSFASVMEGLARADGPRIIGSRLAGGRAVLGICVGMQVMFERGVEGIDLPEAGETTEGATDAAEPEATERIHAHNADEFWWNEDAPDTAAGTPGLAEWPGVVRELRAPRLPHMGWNTVDAPEGTRLFAGIEAERFYFVHSYAATELDIPQLVPSAAPPRVTYATYGERFLAAVENGPLSATQFHPEKSGEAGIQLLRNWLGTL
ncbi:imidazole glycerol phosphate synthase subunit HisH [Gulosibacter faecalis]|jgi:glutamine amidotransferase|uniref:imidazole glycerol phosphate synthase subunit HisH n=1 Tax=Gulosibacter faecalis TaxID=272240 RepID=UPI00038216EF|nr:imidazole glycerol phosphate synthase subunit HisH [Gulosibacter faecalis]